MQMLRRNGRPAANRIDRAMATVSIGILGAAIALVATQADRHFDPKSGGFQSKQQSTGAPFRHRYKKAGTFYVICLVHPDQMRMKIVVK